MASGKHNRGLVAVWIAVAAVGLGMDSGWLQEMSAQEVSPESSPEFSQDSQPIQQLNSPDPDPMVLPVEEPPLDLPAQPDPPPSPAPGILDQPQTEAIRSELRLLRQDVLDILIRIQSLENLLEGPSLQQESSTQAEIVGSESTQPPDAADPSPDPTPEASPEPSPSPQPTDPPSSPPESITLDVGTQTISLPGDVLFDFDQAELRPEATSLLQRVANRLTEQQTGRVLVVGHTDDVGEDNYNLVLSLDRANAVKDFLRDAIPNANQFNWSSSGYGAAQPVASNDTEVGRQRNRRVDIIIAP